MFNSDRDALQFALWIIENYEIDTRTVGGGEDTGFCQGSFYKRALDFLNEYCAREGITPAGDFPKIGRHHVGVPE